MPRDRCPFLRGDLRAVREKARQRDQLYSGREVRTQSLLLRSPGPAPLRGSQPPSMDSSLSSGYPWSHPPAWALGSSPQSPSLQDVEQISRTRGSEGQSPAGQGTGRRPRQEKRPAVRAVPYPALTATRGRASQDDSRQSKAHLTYLCVGGLAQCVAAMPEDRYLSLRRSMRRTFTKSLGAGGLDWEQGAKPTIQGQEACLRGGAWWCSPGGDHPARGPRRDIVGDEGVVLYSLQDLKASRDVRYSPAQEHPRERVPAPQGTPRPASSLSRSLY